MPNWNYTHYVVMGDKKELNDLASLLNSLFFKKPVRESDFGTHWLVNFHNAFHENFYLSKEEFHGNLRGEIEIPLPIDEKNPDRYRELSDEEKRNCFKVEDGKLQFSAYSAHFQSPVIENDILEKYPSVKVYFQSQTEMYDDGCIYDPEGKAGFPYFYFCDGVEGVTKGEIGAYIIKKPYYKNDLDKIAEDLRKWGPEIELPEKLSFDYLASDEFSKAFHKEYERLMKAGKDTCYATYEAFSILKD